MKQRFRASTRLRKHEVTEGGVCNNYWIHVKLTREVWVTITESTWKASSTAILSSETTWLPAEYEWLFLFLGIYKRKTLLFEVSVFKVSTSLSVFRGLRFAWHSHCFGLSLQEGESLPPFTKIWHKATTCIRILLKRNRSLHNFQAPFILPACPQQLWVPFLLMIFINSLVSTCIICLHCVVL